MEEEIDLIDYIKVIIKRWKLILTIFLVAVFVSAGLSFTMPKTYQAEALVKTGKAEGKVLENTTETVELFKESFPEVTLSIPKSTNLLKIKALGETPQKALNRVNNTVDALLARHQEIYNKAKLSLEENIADIKNGLAETKVDIENLEKKIKAEEETYSEARARILQSYILILEQAKTRKRGLEKELKEKGREMDTNFEPTQLEFSPTLPENPIKPKIKLNILVAGVLGLFIGVLAAFGKQWWAKETNQI